MRANANYPSGSKNLFDHIIIIQGVTKMAKKDYFLIVDTETTQDGLVADFGAIVVDRKGTIYTTCSVLIAGIYNDMENHPLFFTSDESGVWSKDGQDKRYAMYSTMLKEGTRMLASIAAVNKWLAGVCGKYDPYLTAYNLSFDQNKCSNTGIDLTQFDKSFCLWHAAYTKWAFTKAYKNAALWLHAFNPPTDLGNMTYKTNAETMARFCTGNLRLEDEPHTALEDAQYYELPILLKLIKTTKKCDWLNPEGFNWRKVQVNENFTAL